MVDVTKAQVTFHDIHRARKGVLVDRIMAAAGFGADRRDVSAA